MQPFLVQQVELQLDKYESDKHLHRLLSDSVVVEPAVIRYTMCTSYMCKIMHMVIPQTDNHHALIHTAVCCYYA